MEAEIPTRFLARAFVKEKVSLTRKAVFNRIGDLFATDDLAVDSITVIDTTTGAITPATLVKPQEKKGWGVVSQATSVDVEYRGDGIGTGPTFEEFLSRSSEVLAHVLRVSGQSASRLACVQERLLRQLDEEELRAVGERVIKLPEGVKAVREWDTKAAWRNERRFAGHTEECNELIAVRRMQGEIALVGRVKGAEPQSSILTEVRHFDRIRIDIDINTLPTSTDARFATDDAVGFFREAVGWHRELKLVAHRFALGDADE